MSRTTEAFARARIDGLLKDAGWDVADGASVLFEHTLSDGTRADYVLCDRAGRSMAALEAKHAGIDPIRAQDQGRHALNREAVRQLHEDTFFGSDTGGDHGTYMFAGPRVRFASFCNGTTGFVTCSLKEDALGHELGHAFGMEHKRHGWYGFNPRQHQIDAMRRMTRCAPEPDQGFGDKEWSDETLVPIGGLTGK